MEHGSLRLLLGLAANSWGTMANAMKGARVLLVVLGIALTAYPSVAQTTWDLVTPEEDARDRAAPQTPAPPDLPPPPVIRVVRPDLSKPIRNPVTIEVQFAAGPNAPIDMRTFNATYGRLGLNITRRLLEHAVTTSDGLSAENVNLPSGNHRVTLSIADTSGKRASQTFQLSVSN